RALRAVGVGAGRDSRLLAPRARAPRRHRARPADADGGGGVRSIVFLLLLVAAPAYAGDDLFASANKDYSPQSYDAAIAKYEQLVKSGTRHPDLFYDLGNAYFRSAEKGAPNRLGPAILAYERALAMEPGFDDARYNLDVARDVVGARYGQDKVKDAAADPMWIRVANYFPLATLAWVFFGLDA